MNTKEKEEKKVGDPIDITIKRNGQELYVTGIIKETRKAYGNTEYCISKAKIDNDFWVRPVREG